MEAKILDLERGLHAEAALLRALGTAGYTVRPAGDRKKGGAPLKEVAGKWVRAADFEVLPLDPARGVALQIEVKSLTPLNPASGGQYPEEFDCFKLRREVLRDYLAQRDQNFYIVVQRNPRLEGSTGTSESVAPRQWFAIAARDLEPAFQQSPDDDYVAWGRNIMMPLSALFPEIEDVPPILIRTEFYPESGSGEWTGIYLRGSHKPARHSVLCSSDMLQETEVCELLMSGIKVIVWTKPGAATAFRKGVIEGLVGTDAAKHLDNSRLLEIHEVDHPGGLLLVDGAPVSGTLDSQVAPSSFDREQFTIEHAGADEHIVVQAGAGSGKTTVMLGRILFLLATQPGIDPCHLTLVTFTRKATQEMRERLGKLLTARLNVARKAQQRFVRWLTFSNDFTIQTIDAYCKGLIEKYGKSIARDERVQLTKLRMRRREEIELALESELSRDPLQPLFGKAHHEFVSLAMDFWTQMDMKSVGFEDEMVHDMEAHPNPGAQILFRVIRNAAERLRQWKSQEGLTEMSDLGFVANELDLAEVQEGPRGLRFLMIDEFQDTSDNQIDLIAKLAGQNARLRVFCVGDEKQAIYRFRGAQHTALGSISRKIKQQNPSQPCEYTLTSNYRTAPALLTAMQSHFETWRQAGLLPSGGGALQPKAARLQSEQSTILIRTTRSKKIDQTFKQELGKILALIFDDPDVTTLYGKEKRETITFLVRDNAHADVVREVVDGMHRADVRWIESQNDRLFIDRPAVEAPAALLSLLRWLASPYDLRATVNLAWSGWVDAPPWMDLEALEIGDWDSLDESVRAERRAEWVAEVTKPLAYLRVQSRTCPLPSLLARAVRETRLLELYQARSAAGTDNTASLAEVLAFRRQRFEQNLFLVITHLLADPSESQWSLAGCIGWLERRLNIDRDTLGWQPDDAQPSLQGSSPPNTKWLEVMTVHKAKGLERKYVVLPITTKSNLVRDQGFFAPGKSTLGRNTLRWRIKGDTGASILCPEDVTTTEQVEVDREETRLLYVAMTRAQSRLYIIRSEGRPPIKSWSHLLETGGL